MSKLADGEKQDRKDRMAFQTNLAHDVKSLLAEFAKARRKRAQDAADERRAVLLAIKNQVAGLGSSVMALGEAKPQAPKAKVGKSPVAAKPDAPKAKIVAPPVAAPTPKVVEAPVAAKPAAPKARIIPPPVTIPSPKAAAPFGSAASSRKEPKKERSRGKAGKAKPGRK